MKDEKPSIAKAFMARRIAEFPTLYRNGDAVIAKCVIGNLGGVEWEKGVLVQKDLSWNEKTKKFGKYPLRMQLETAISMVNTACAPQFNSSSYHSPINLMPDDMEKSWAEEISMFLFQWSKLSVEDYTHIAKAKCFAYYSSINDSYFSRLMDGFKEFLKKAPEWQARLDNIRYLQQHGIVDPATFTGMGI